MRLSDAIRLGAMLHPQTFGHSCDYAGGAIVATCALAAAREAGFTVNDDEPLRSNTMACPACGKVDGLVYVTVPTTAVVVHLNDVHHWSRERIADWVETQELAAGERQRALTNSTSDVRGTTEIASPVLTTRV